MPPRQGWQATRSSSPARQHPAPGARPGRPAGPGRATACAPAVPSHAIRSAGAHRAGRLSRYIATLVLKCLNISAHSSTFRRCFSFHLIDRPPDGRTVFTRCSPAPIPGHRPLMPVFAAGPGCCYPGFRHRHGFCQAGGLRNASCAARDRRRKPPLSWMPTMVPPRRRLHRSKESVRVLSPQLGHLARVRYGWRGHLPTVMIWSAWAKLRSSNARCPPSSHLSSPTQNMPPSSRSTNISSSVERRWTGANPKGTCADHEHLPAGDVGTERTFQRVHPPTPSCRCLLAWAT